MECKYIVKYDKIRCAQPIVYKKTLDEILLEGTEDEDEFIINKKGIFIKDGWHPWWVLFLNILIYYSIAKPIDNHFHKLDLEDDED